MAEFAVLASAFVLWVLKRLYWRAIDRGEMPAGRASALGLPADRGVRVFEHPHTEANYLTKEMGFVLARKHARRLRIVAVVLFADVPALCALSMLLLPQVDAAPWLAVAAISALLGTFVERWLFFAQAKHVVMLYY
jgi:DMSO reductase anchor subunit